jgi:hypothetical protein
LENPETGRTTESQELQLQSQGTENVALEECRESKAMFIKNIQPE